MNKNKIIFAIIWIILFLALALTVLNLNKWWTVKKTVKRDIGTFNVWIFWDDKSKFSAFITNFKKRYPKYNNFNFIVESFSDYEAYFYTLTSAFNKWLWPDIFVLNWSEVSVLQDQALYIDSQTISVNDFRKNYKAVFSDLIYKAENWKEYLIGVPIWYETLWIFYNRRYFNWEDMKTWEDLNKKIYDLEEIKTDVIPLWIWNWSTVKYSSDILTQFFVLDGITSVIDISSKNVLQAFSVYQNYWDENYQNAYNTIAPIYSSENNIKLFSQWKIWAIIWYPRTLFDIDKYGYSKHFLLASPFPRYLVWDSSKTLVNYNYFAINRDTVNKTLAKDMLKYMTSKEWAANYLNNFPYYLPAMIDLEWYVMEEKIYDKYNIIYKDFYSYNTEFVSFDKGIKAIYDRELTNLIDTKTNNSSKLFESFKNKLICATKKALTLKSLSVSCK